MRVRTFLLLTGILVCHSIYAQNNNIAQFVVWKPKAGQEASFENGYKQHLHWHKTNGDTWNWYGWFFVNGPRDGQFMDATFDHTWSDFDRRNKPAEDMADNQLHVYPFADVQEVFKVAYQKELSIADTSSLKSKFLRLITLQVTDMVGALKLVERLKSQYQRNAIRHFLVYKPVDGCLLNQLILLLGFNSYAEYGKAENLQEQIATIEADMKARVITSMNSETLVYRADMSLFP